jgi:hypothetical protein
MEPINLFNTFTAKILKIDRQNIIRNEILKKINRNNIYSLKFYSMLDENEKLEDKIQFNKK